VLREEREQMVRLPGLDDRRGDVTIAGPIERFGFPVSDDEGDLGGGMVFEPLEQGLQVGAAAGREDGDAGHEILIISGDRPARAAQDTRSALVHALFRN
jgi:hypothetical protein